MLKLLFSFLLIAFAYFASAEEAYFRFINESPTFAIKLTNSTLIQHARELISGNTTENPHIQGRIVKAEVHWNYPWSFMVEPDSISFFNATEDAVCDMGIRWINRHLDQVCDTLLPGCHWCPWSSKFIEEIKL
ncbi:hypothetical protein CU098_006928 [Rhizopus stolonifer]|uniref:BP74 N-terminal domain-containing protein n=1 Tax=Rhizopus stolonifer TaxID=4846 RepID=A0A367IM81_RHIST|nr:hypothetical protein CU098_006928 [Rhizopus stolonifer]